MHKKYLSGKIERKQFVIYSNGTGMLCSSKRERNLLCLLFRQNTLVERKGIKVSEYFHYTFRNYRKGTREVYEEFNSYWGTIVGNWKNNLFFLFDGELKRHNCHPY